MRQYGVSPRSLLQFKPVLQVRQAFIELLDRLFRRSLLAVTELDLDAELERRVEFRLQREEVRDNVCEVLDLRWFELGLGNDALGGCCRADPASSPAIW